MSTHLARAPWWRWIHRALMPDYNRHATTAWWTVTLAGAAAVLVCLGHVGLRLDWTAWLQLAAAAAGAIAAGLFPVRVPGTRHAYTAGEILIFLVLLLWGPAAAALVAAGEAFAGSCRTSRRWTSRLFSPASAALAMLATGVLPTVVTPWMHTHGVPETAALLVAAMVMSTLYFLVNATLVSGVLHAKRGEPLLQPAGLLSVFRWVGMAYAGSASVAVLLFVAHRQQGVGALLVMLPLLIMLLVLLHLYFRQQEQDLQWRIAHDELATREAALLAREAEAAQHQLRELQLGHQRFHSAFEHASIGMALLSFDGRILQSNPALCALLGRTAEALVQQSFHEMLATEDRAYLAHRLGLSRSREFEAFSAELHCQHADGSPMRLSLHCSFFTEPESDQPCLILQAQDVTSRRAAQASLEHLAYHDSLTGLPNRRRFLECLAGVLARNQGGAQQAWAVLFLDFDHFKAVNDSLGHGVGDLLLQQLARRLQETLRPSDTVARLGGDEFAILADRIEHEGDAVVLAERLMQALQKPFTVAGHELQASASVGITFSAFGYDNADAVLRDADTAMYKAKADGKARFAVFDSGLHLAVSERLRLEGELAQAIATRQLSVLYQPIFDLRDAPGVRAALPHLRGFEALVRWQRQDGEVLLPAGFLPIAKEAGLMRQVSDFVLHCASRQLRLWQCSHPDWAELTMGINLAADDLTDSTLVARVSRAIVEAGVRADHLTLELTEDILMGQAGGPADRLADLRRLGVRLAVDDFGTGYSNLGHLSRLAIDDLKIDGSLVRRMKPGSDDAAVVAAIVQLGTTLCKTVVAEGIETAEQIAQLQALGCAMGQGFYLSAPQPEQEISQWLAAGR